MSALFSGLLLLCVLSFAAAQHVECGEIECGGSSAWPLVPGTTYNAREIAKNVTFATPYCKAPKVLLSITIVDTDKTTNQRLWIRLTYTSSTYFTAACHTWLDSIVIRCAIKWLAIGN